MPEQKMSYQERWHKLANEYAIAHGNDDLGVHRINMYYEKDARIAVAAQAEAIREVLKLFRAPIWTEQYLLEHGYIEPKTEKHETGYDWHYEQIVTPKKKQIVYVAQTKDDKGTDNLLTGFVIDFTNTEILVSVSGHSISFPYSHVYVKSQKDATERTDNQKAGK